MERKKQMWGMSLLALVLLFVGGMAFLNYKIAHEVDAPQPFSQIITERAVSFESTAAQSPLPSSSEVTPNVLSTTSSQQNKNENYNRVQEAPLPNVILIQ